MRIGPNSPLEVSPGGEAPCFALALVVETERSEASRPSR